MCMGEWEYMCEFCFVCFRSVHGWLGMHVWVNVFTMPLLCADSGPWRKMSRAWPPVSVKTTSSDSTCPSHQKSAWGAAEARQEKVIVEVVRKAISVAWRVFVEHTCKRFMSVLSAYRGAVLRSSANLPGRSPPPHWTGRGPVNESIMFGELPSILLFFFFFFFFWGVCMSLWELMCEWMSLRCHSCAQTLDRGERCLGPDLQCPR